MLKYCELWGIRLVPFVLRGWDDGTGDRSSGRRRADRALRAVETAAVRLEATGAAAAQSGLPRGLGCRAAACYPPGPVEEGGALVSRVQKQHPQQGAVLEAASGVAPAAQEEAENGCGHRS